MTEDTLAGRIARFRELREKATKGPWEWQDWTTNDNGADFRTLAGPPSSRPGGPDDMFPALPYRILTVDDPVERESDKDFIVAAANDALPLLEDCQKRITELQTRQLQQSDLICTYTDEGVRQRNRIEELEQEIKLRCDLHGDCERENERLKSKVEELERENAKIRQQLIIERHEPGYVPLSETAHRLEVQALKAQLESAKDEWTKESAIHTAKAAETLALCEAGRKQLESAEALLRAMENAARYPNLPPNYQWSDNNRHKFEFGKMTAAAHIAQIVADYFAKKEKGAVSQAADMQKETVI